ncbi:response regulator [Kriegella aquimaris]|uniref:Response regulator receiver domain-containing protein n=1 Tax=Kriegella aquimaris TaxID=192904 RepID=A0A1G9LXU0_9FLAO|nr:response regulator [Kriegella aquimaris]SDL66561.1 Response regulator receiver domain-containing protein [Kriegella aquimaris]
MKKFESTCIIDDDPIFIYGTKRVMKEVGFCNKIMVFNNGQDAIEALTEMVGQNKELPEIIFVDLNMPIMNGWEFLEDFVKIPNKNRKAVTVYIISSSVDPRDLERVKNYEVVNNYILKPISSKDLEDILNSLR